jgi:ribosomal protein S8
MIQNKFHQYFFFYSLENAFMFEHRNLTNSSFLWFLLHTYKTEGFVTNWTSIKEKEKKHAIKNRLT